MTLLDNNISTIAANIAGPSMLFIPHQASSGRKWMQDAIANDGEVLDPAKRSRKEKRCWKCFIDKCPGRVLRVNCTNACASCNRRDCKGKDSRHPSFPCEKLRNQSSWVTCSNIQLNFNHFIMISNERWFNKVRNYMILSLFLFSLFPFWGVFFGCPQTWPPCQSLLLQYFCPLCSNFTSC